MNRIQRLQTFLDDYKTKTPSLQKLGKYSYEYNQQELIKEYVKLGHHPYPDEYLSHIEPKLETQGNT